MSPERKQCNAKVRAMYEDVSTRTRRFHAGSAVAGTVVFLLLAAASQAQTVRTADATARAQQSGVPVHVVVTVEARKGEESPVINREDVMVREEGEREDFRDVWPKTVHHQTSQGPR